MLVLLTSVTMVDANAAPEELHERFIVKYNVNTWSTNAHIEGVIDPEIVKSVKTINADESLYVVTTHEGWGVDDVNKFFIDDAHTMVEYIEPDRRVYATNTYFPLQWGLQHPQYGMDVASAWNVSQGSGDVVIAVLDSGIDLQHEDLKNNIYRNPNETIDGKDNDGSGKIDDLNGWDFVDGDNNPQDENGHGTHVAGIIAAENNQIGVVGVAPKVKILPLRFLDADGSGYIGDAISAIKYAQRRGIKIMNHSWAGSDFSQSLYDTMKSSGMLHIVAAGNEGLNIDREVIIPASFDLENMITVGALNEDGNIASYSNYGTKSVDLYAPGTEIVSTYLNTIDPYYTRYTYLSGTSMATPFVSGVAALIASKNPTYTPLQIKHLLLKNVQQHQNSWSLTGGILKTNLQDQIQANNVPMIYSRDQVYYAGREEGSSLLRDVSAYDFEDGNLAVTIKTHNVDFNVPNTYDVTYQVSDAQGNQKEQTNKVMIVADYNLNGWLYRNNTWYYYERGIPKTGWLLWYGSWYYMNQNGVMQTGWQYINNVWYYLYGGGNMATSGEIDGWVIQPNGAAVPKYQLRQGWDYTNNAWYYYENGAKKTSWARVGNIWYYFNNEGVMQTGWRYIGNSWYYLLGNGHMVNGWQLVDGTWYYLQANGAMATGFITLGNIKYHLQPSGAMSTGWKYINQNWYYFYANGHMATSGVFDGWLIQPNGIGRPK